MSPIARLLDNAVELGRLLQTIAGNDPVAALLLLSGSLLVALVVGAAGYLVLGALVQWVTPPRSSPTHRPAR